MTDQTPKDPLELFYYNNNLVSIEEKIKGLERQLQVFPCLNVSLGERLKRLEISFMKLMSATGEVTNKTSKNKWKQQYKQINDTPVNGSCSILGTHIQIEKESFCDKWNRVMDSYGAERGTWEDLQSI
jgi:hypothetical protein